MSCIRASSSRARCGAAQSPAEGSTSAAEERQSGRARRGGGRVVAVVEQRRRHVDVAQHPVRVHGGGLDREPIAVVAAGDQATGRPGCGAVEPPSAGACCGWSGCRAQRSSSSRSARTGVPAASARCTSSSAVLPLGDRDRLAVSPDLDRAQHQELEHGASVGRVSEVSAPPAIVAGMHQLLRRLVTGDDAAITAIVEASQTSDDPLILVAAALFAPRRRTASSSGPNGSRRPRATASSWRSRPRTIAAIASSSTPSRETTSSTIRTTCSSPGSPTPATTSPRTRRNDERRVSFSTEGLARACAVHPKRTVAVWVAVVLVSFVVIAVLLGSALTTDGDVTSNPESKQAAALIHESFPPEPTPSEIVVVRSDRFTVDEPEFRGEGAGALATAARRSASSPTRRATTARTTSRSSRRTPRDDGAARDARRRGRPAGRAGRGGERAGRLPGLDHRLADGRRRLREALRRRPAEGRAADRAARGADRAPARVRRGRGRPRAGAARAAVDRGRGCPDGARRAGVRGLVLRREHDLGDGPRARDRLRALHPLALPGGARPRAREGRRDRRVGCDGEPRGALQRDRVRARDVRDAARARHGAAEPRARRDPRRHRLGRSRR